MIMYDMVKMVYSISETLQTASGTRETGLLSRVGMVIVLIMLLTVAESDTNSASVD